MKSNNNIIIGAFFVILGILFLLNNFNLFNFDFGDIFRLWPIVLIYIGVGMLPIDAKTKMYLETSVIVLFFVLLVSLPYITDNSNRHRSNFDYEYNDDDESGAKFDLETKQIDCFLS